MKLRTRLLVVGALLPLVLLVLSIAFSGVLFKRALLQDLDRRLLAQAAVESVSLFDSPSGRPHMHVSSSPLASEVAAFAPMSALYDPRGRRLYLSPETAPMPQSIVPSSVRTDLSTITIRGIEYRRLSVLVPRENEGNYTIQLWGFMQPLERTMNVYYRTGAGVVGGAVVLLVIVLWWQSGKIIKRVQALSKIGSESPDESSMQKGDEIDYVRSVLERSIERMRRAKESEGRFLANAAHQLRTPLSVLRTEFDLALRKPRNAQELQAVLTRASEEVARLANLARALLDYESVKVQAISLSMVDLVPLTRELLDRFASHTGARGIKIVTNFEPEVWIRGNGMLLEQAITNIVDNAIQYSPDGQTIDISIREEPKSVRFVVQDHGCGIAQEHQARIFEPFYRITGEHSMKVPGSGLGLCIAAEIVKKHDGLITVRSPVKDGIGTEFTMTFPRSDTNNE